MSTSWPPQELSEFVEALPFEHLMRKRAPQEALARWRTESQALQACTPCRVALVLDCEGDPEMVRQTIACWELQTWPDRMLVLLGQSAHQLKASLHASLPVAVVERLTPQTCAELGIDWVVPAVAGDLLHPSLAGVVARQSARGASAVAWDWLEATRCPASVKLATRRRGPWRDCAAEFDKDLRQRAFAVPARHWDGHPATHAWRVRMAHPGLAESACVHPEPLGIYACGTDATTPEVALASARWGAEFERAQGRIRPSRPATGVSVIILYRDRPELTLKAIDSVLRQQWAGRLQLVLVDNQSSPETRQTIQSRLDRLPHGVAAVVVPYDAAFNHSRQSNLGAKAATEEVLLLLNNDVELQDPEVIDELARWALVPGVATVGACVVDHDGRATGGGFRARRTPGAEFNSPVEEATGETARIARCTVGNTFACAAMSASTFESLGGLDEVDFPVGYNDVDFCLRATSRGWTHVNLGHLRVTHAVGASRARCDEVSQKLALRCAHPWLPIRALREFDSDSVTIQEALLPAISPRKAAPPGVTS